TRAEPRRSSADLGLIELDVQRYGDQQMRARPERTLRKRSGRARLVVRGDDRSEERRVGKERRSRGAPGHVKDRGRYEASVMRECGFFFFSQAEDGIRDWSVTGVQTCALPIYSRGTTAIICRPRPDRT